MKMKEFREQTSGIGDDTELFILSPGSNARPHRTAGFKIDGLGTGETPRAYITAGAAADQEEEVGEVETGDATQGETEEQRKAREDAEALAAAGNAAKGTKLDKQENPATSSNTTGSQSGSSQTSNTDGQAAKSAAPAENLNQASVSSGAGAAQPVTPQPKTDGKEPNKPAGEAAKDAKPAGTVTAK
jgi:hypothetical protein